MTPGITARNVDEVAATVRELETAYSSVKFLGHAADATKLSELEGLVAKVSDATKCA